MVLFLPWPLNQKETKLLVAHFSVSTRLNSFKPVDSWFDDNPWLAPPNPPAASSAGNHLHAAASKATHKITTTAVVSRHRLQTTGKPPLRWWYLNREALLVNVIGIKENRNTLRLNLLHARGFRNDYRYGGKCPASDPVRSFQSCVDCVCGWSAYLGKLPGHSYHQTPALSIMSAVMFWWPSLGSLPKNSFRRPLPSAPVRPAPSTSSAMGSTSIPVIFFNRSSSVALGWDWIHWW